MNEDITGIVPEQVQGNEIEAHASVQLHDEIDARRIYKSAKQKLLNVNEWHNVGGLISAHFKLVDRDGRDVERGVAEGDFLKIDIPGPGSSEGNGFDWVMVEEIKEINQEHTDSIGLRVKPCPNPLGTGNKAAHFYSEAATSSFIVTRNEHIVSAWIIDRNIKPNKDADTAMDKIRNFAVGIGAIGLFSKIQWQGLAKGLIENV